MHTVRLVSELVPQILFTKSQAIYFDKFRLPQPSTRELRSSGLLGYYAERSGTSLSTFRDR